MYRTVLYCLMRMVKVVSSDKYDKNESAVFFRGKKNPNHPGPCVCKYDTNIGAHL